MTQFISTTTFPGRSSQCSKNVGGAPPLVALSRNRISLARCPHKNLVPDIYCANGSLSETMTICMSLARPMILCTGSRDNAGSADQPLGLVRKICVT